VAKELATKSVALPTVIIL